MVKVLADVARGEVCPPRCRQLPSPSVPRGGKEQRESQREEARVLCPS